MILARRRLWLFARKRRVERQVQLEHVHARFAQQAEVASLDVPSDVSS